ncbi:glutathione peroxidase [Seleniivibrio sp.]|uniref:glutathione peroxidase n=1 Tax=Seleniivibrio sp. TaxID=2898801 RepID=UPI0025E41CB5|nr:glutathione peroxidase [Seleniivibrio sp.]MCD8553696.1 glutathione peroxidase [Seleniivibrio sp.]
MLTYDYVFPLLNGQMQDLMEYEGKVVLIVNTASKCGFTPQYEGLEELYRQFRDEGFVILGFPCNQFGEQEPGTEDDITNFLECNYTVTFPIFKKVLVNGENANPLFKKLKDMAPGTMGTKDIKWNFTKFLVSRDRKNVIRFASTKTPDSIRGYIADELMKI